MRTFAQAVINGLLLGLIYTSIAAGLSLTLGVMGIVNVAHSAIAMLAAYVAWILVRTHGLNPLVAFLIVALAFLVVGLLVERTLVRRTYGKTAVASLLSLFGLMIVLESGMTLIWTTNDRAIPSHYPSAFQVIGLRIGGTRLVAGVVTLVAVLSVHAFLMRSRTGRGIRAMAGNRIAAEVLGIDTKRLSMLLFAIGTALAGVGGVAMAMVFSFNPQQHFNWLTLAILVVVTGGLGSVLRTMAGGLAIALLESLVGTYWSVKYVPIALYGLLITLLWIRTEGLGAVRARSL